MKKILSPLILIFTVQLLSAQSVKLTKVKGRDFTTGGDYYDGKYISYASLPPETRYIKGFYISEPVTQELYEKVMGENPSTVKNPKAPVTDVTIIDAMNFCMKLSELDRYQTAYEIDHYVWYNFKNLLYGIHGYRLPTEEEWEMCAKSGIIDTEKTNLSEWVHNTWTTSTMKNVFLDSDYGSDKNKIPFDKRVNVTVRGAGSKEKRRALNPEAGENNLGFRIVIPDMTEFGYEEQPVIPSSAKADTSIDQLDQYLTSLENEKTPDADGFIHATISLAELFPCEDNYKIVDTLGYTLEKHDNLRVTLNLKDCRWEVSYEEYSNENYRTFGYFRNPVIEGLILPDTTLSVRMTECENLRWIQLPQNFPIENNSEENPFGYYEENTSLKYIFVTNKNAQLPSGYNFGCLAQTKFIQDTFEHYKSITQKFDEPVIVLENPEGCSSSFNNDEHEAMYYGDTFDCEITIPENQMIKQNCKIRFVSKYNRDVIFMEVPYKFNGKGNKIKLKKIDTRKFDDESMYNEYSDHVMIQIQIIFEDGTVIDYYDSDLYLI